MRRVEYVRDRNDPAGERDRLTAEALWIAAAIPVLVMGQRDPLGQSQQRAEQLDVLLGQPSVSASSVTERPIPATPSPGSRRRGTRPRGEATEDLDVGALEIWLRAATSCSSVTVRWYSRAAAAGAPAANCERAATTSFDRTACSGSRGRRLRAPDARVPLVSALITRNGTSVVAWSVSGPSRSISSNPSIRGMCRSSTTRSGGSATNDSIALSGSVVVRTLRTCRWTSSATPGVLIAGLAGLFAAAPCAPASTP